MNFHKYLLLLGVGSLGVRLENGKYPTLRPFFKQQVFAVLF